MDPKDEEGKAAEQPEEVKEPKQSPGTKSTEKTLTQSEVNKLLADERRKHEAKFKELQTEYLGFKQTVEQREQAANEAAAEKVEALRKDLPEPIIKLLDNLSPVQQLEWLSDPANVVVKKEIPKLPRELEEHGRQTKTIHVV